MNLLKSIVSALVFQATCVTPFAQANGDALYTNKCANCHQMNGEGVPPAYPPLAGSDFLKKLTQGRERKKLISILKKGLKGPITVNGVDYNGFMPPAVDDLSNSEIAALLTYVTNSWGNQAEPFSEDEIRKSNSPE